MGKIYRDFGKVTAIFNEENKDEIDNRYQCRLETMQENGVEGYKMQFMDWKLFGADAFQNRIGYSSFLTNVFLLQRFEPYSSAFILGNTTKDADRAKYCLQGLYDTVCTDRSNTELIPEFFFLPEFYQNRNRYHTGLR